MRLLLVIFISLFFNVQSYANIALDELNTLLAKKEKLTHVEKKNRDEIKDLSDNYYFVFVYKSTCPHCHKFAPILSDFSKSFHIKVTSYTLDGEPLDDFDGKPLTPSIFQSFYVDGGYKPTVPALFLVNRHTKEGYAVLFGEATPYQLAHRVYELKKHIAERFHA